MIKNVIFDMDGTILNTLDDLCDSVNYMLSECGYPSVTIEEVRGFVGNGVQLLIKRALKRDVAEAEFNRCMAVFSAHYDRNKENKTAPYDGIFNLMQLLKTAGIRMAVVSNKYDKAVKSLTQKLFAEFISVAIGEGDGIMPKPASDGVIKAMKDLGAHPYDTVYVGDSDVDYMTALNSRLPFIGVTWGFRSEELLKSLGTIYIAHNPEDIYKIINVRRFALVGHGLKHTLSPQLHAKLFAYSGINAEYLVYDVDDVEKFFPIADGLNVTIPHKKTYINKLCSVDTFASELGAINCVDEKYCGYNTDYYGFITDFNKFCSLKNASVLVIGYGGAGRVIVRALMEAGHRVTVAIRGDHSKVDVNCNIIDIDSLNQISDSFDVLVNATPIGMYPNINAIPVDKSVIKNCNYVYDVIYNPTVTQLVDYALANGKKAKTAMGMLVYQAVKAHEIWYGAQFNDGDIANIIAELNAML